MTEKRERLVLAYLRSACSARELLDAFEAERAELQGTLDSAIAALSSPETSVENTDERVLERERARLKAALLAEFDTTVRAVENQATHAQLQSVRLGFAMAATAVLGNESLGMFAGSAAPQAGQPSVSR
ncbi:MAG: hypothetical protein ACHREM_04775 [Polyangiales bacterium]